jgi:hypothetical protein
MGVWRGLGVIEPCDAKAQEQFGVGVAYTVDDAVHVRAFPPAWVCPLTNGETVTVSILG